MQQGITIDAYTKVVLTIIAACLLWIAVSRASTPAWGQGRGAKVQEVRMKGPLDVRVIEIRLRSGESVPVNVTNVINSCVMMNCTDER